MMVWAADLLSTAWLSGLEKLYRHEIANVYAVRVKLIFIMLRLWYGK
jgi:hypothetical protein